LNRPRKRSCIGGWRRRFVLCTSAFTGLLITPRATRQFFRKRGSRRSVGQSRTTSIISRVSWDTTLGVWGWHPRSCDGHVSRTAVEDLDLNQQDRRRTATAGQRLRLHATKVLLRVAFLAFALLERFKCMFASGGVRWRSFQW
jgi:hypothetical protein